MPKYTSILKLTTKAECVWHMLHGTFIVYKPQGEHVAQTINTLKIHLCRDLNTTLKQRPAMNQIRIEGETNKDMTIVIQPSYADHPLLTGPRYQIQDMRMLAANNMDKNASGILVMGIGQGTKIAQEIIESKPIKFYKLKGILGKATNTFFTDGRVVEKTTFKHVQRYHVDMICASMQSSHQKQMFEQCGVHIQTQAAYELAAQGLLRSANNKIPMVYSIKCIDFNPPEFSLEIVCTNEHDMYLKSLVHEIGMQVRSSATCTQVQCVRFGIFNLDHALLKKNWNLKDIAENMAMCKNLLAQNPFMRKPLDPILKEYTEVPRIESKKPLQLMEEKKQINV